MSKRPDQKRGRRNKCNGVQPNGLSRRDSASTTVVGQLAVGRRLRKGSVKVAGLSVRGALGSGLCARAQAMLVTSESETKEMS